MFGGDAANGVWDSPRFGDIPLGSMKVPSSGLLGLVSSGLLNLTRGVSFFLFFFEGFVAFAA